MPKLTELRPRTRKDIPSWAEVPLSERIDFRQSLSVSSESTVPDVR